MKTTKFYLPRSRKETEKAMAPHSSILAWKIPWMEKPGGLQSMGSLRVGQDWATSLSLFTFMHWRRKWQPTPVLLPGESQGRRSLVAAVYGVTQSRTRLKWFSSSSSMLWTRTKNSYSSIVGREWESRRLEIHWKIKGGQLDNMCCNTKKAKCYAFMTGRPNC